MRSVLVSVLVIFASLSQTTAAMHDPLEGTEHISKFEGTIAVQPDGSLEIQETIVVIAAGDALKDGIRRSFSRVPGEPGVQVDAAVLDGQPEPFALEQDYHVERVRIGSPDKPLDSSEDVYFLSYRTPNVVTKASGKAHLIWHATGSDWPVPISECTVKVILADDVEHAGIKYSGTTGNEGSGKADYSSEFGLPNTVTYLLQRPTWPGEGLVMNIEWPAPDPTILETIWHNIRTKETWMIATVFLFMLAVVHVLVKAITWTKPKAS
jgi:hypothetical protein